MSAKTPTPAELTATTNGEAAIQMVSDAISYLEQSLDKPPLVACFVAPISRSLLYGTAMPSTKTPRI